MSTTNATKIAALPVLSPRRDSPAAQLSPIKVPKLTVRTDQQYSARLGDYRPSLQDYGQSTPSDGPRRHSIMPSTAGLANKMADFTFLSPLPSSRRQSIALESRSMLLCGIESSPTSPVPPLPSPTTPMKSTLRRMPFKSNRDLLWFWGNAYLGNSTTADVFVNPVPLETFGSPNISNTHITIRARVSPKAEERKPFIIQRQFDLKELRKKFGNGEKTDMRPSTDRVSEPIRLTEGVPLPIHTDYALYFLPVLAGLMLSGHLRKGDVIDLPLPYPQHWMDVISYIYTGGELHPKARENMVYLAGQIDGDLKRGEV